jgi:hypothetical protein
VYSVSATSGSTGSLALTFRPSMVSSMLNSPHPSLIAPKGHSLMHCPQRMHADASMLAFASGLSSYSGTFGASPALTLLRVDRVTLFMATQTCCGQRFSSMVWYSSGSTSSSEHGFGADTPEGAEARVCYGDGYVA